VRECSTFPAPAALSRVGRGARQGRSAGDGAERWLGEVAAAVAEHAPVVEADMRALPGLLRRTLATAASADPAAPAAAVQCAPGCARGAACCSTRVPSRRVAGLQEMQEVVLMIQKRPAPLSPPPQAPCNASCAFCTPTAHLPKHKEPLCIKLSHPPATSQALRAPRWLTNALLVDMSWQHAGQR